MRHRSQRPTRRDSSQSPPFTPEGAGPFSAPFNPSAHARYGHALSRISAYAPVIQRQAENEMFDDEDDAEIQMKRDPAHSMIHPEGDRSVIQRESEDEGDDAGTLGTDLPTEEMGEGIQMKAMGKTAARPDVPAATGGGSALPAPVLGKMERSFGHSFADVRVHSGDEAKTVGALAYTRGTDIHFQPGLYDPLSLGGQELLGHELTHVVQQRAGRVSAPQNKSAGSAPINADSGLEAEADALGARAARGENAAVSGTPSASGAAGGGLQMKADVVQCFPWSSVKSGGKKAIGVGGSILNVADEYVGGPTSDLGGWAGGIGTTAEHFHDDPSSYGSPLDIGISDKIAGGLGFAGLLSAPAQVMGIGGGVKEFGKSVVGEKIDPNKGRVRDPKRALEAAGTVGQNALGLVSTGANIVSGASTLAGAAGVAGVASGVAAPIGVAAGLVGMGKNGYQMGMAAYKERQLGKLADAEWGNQTNMTRPQPKGMDRVKKAFTPRGWGEEAMDSSGKTDRLKAIEFSKNVQHKRLKRAGLNFAANTLVTAGGTAGVVGSATGIGAPVGAAVGAGLAGAGLGLKVGGFGVRKIKQGGRNLSAWADAKDQQRAGIGGSHSARFATVVNTVNDHLGPLSFNVKKSSAEKKKAVAHHTDTILKDAQVGRDIFKGLGANQADQARHDRYHDATTPQAEKDELEKKLKKRIGQQLKKRG